MVGTACCNSVRPAIGVARWIASQECRRVCRAAEVVDDGGQGAVHDQHRGRVHDVLARGAHGAPTTRPRRRPLTRIRRDQGHDRRARGRGLAPDRLDVERQFLPARSIRRAWAAGISPTSRPTAASAISTSTMARSHAEVRRAQCPDRAASPASRRRAIRRDQRSKKAVCPVALQADVEAVAVVGSVGDHRRLRCGSEATTAPGRSRSPGRRGSRSA